MFEAIGIVGIAISVAAYIPQLVHLRRERCSTGVSTRAWAMWLVGSVLVCALAVHRRDPVFILLQATSFTSAGAILVLARRYRGMFCNTHTPRTPAEHRRIRATVQATAADDVHIAATER
jgi:lipid-A-disaccharide synthase-like uncharacterized protein